MTEVDDLARWSSTVDWKAQPQNVQASVRRVLRDSLAVMVAGGQLAESAARRRALPLSDGPATVAGSKSTTAVCDAAWLNGCSLVALELDEGNKEIRGHATAHVLPAALAVAEAAHRTGPEFAAAFLAGHEVASRFGRATRLHAGVHPHGNWGVTGAAAAVAHLHRGDARATAAAIDAASALALATPFPVALEGLPVRDAWIGQANASGIRAWAAADSTRGATGVAALSLGRILGEFDAEALTDDAPLAITGGYLKRHASCSYTHPPADAALAVREKRDPEAGVEDIVVETHRLAAALDTRIWPSRLAAMFSVPYVVATALRDGACPPEAFDEAHRADPALKALAAKVRVVHDPALDARLPKERVARLRVRWTDGGEEVVEVPNPVGDADHEPLSEADLTAKAVMLLGATAHRVRDLADALVDASDVAGVMASLREES
ncbi:MmgE/PrpD family protein [Actinoplanes sp. NPDC051411]|uniref:MmgE/PrpD family protein n=1 Tax=Actinoplanes sp. NPDC051411 TaxID=3155522 RepID=UPI0034417A0E